MVLVALPLSVNALFLVVNEGSVHTIVLISYIVLYVFIAMVLDIASSERYVAQLNVPGLANLISLLALIIIANNIWHANVVGFRQYMEYENTYSLYQSVVTQLQQDPNFNSGSKLALMGKAPVSSYMENFGESRLFGVTDFRNDYSRERFIKYYLGFDVEFATAWERRNIREDSRFVEMPEYPYYGYIMRIDDFMVVKLSDQRENFY